MKTYEFKCFIDVDTIIGTGPDEEAAFIDAQARLLYQINHTRYYKNVGREVVEVEPNEYIDAGLVRQIYKN